IPATFGDRSIASLVTSLRNWARGFRAPLWWFFHARCVSVARRSSSVTPYLLQYDVASIENMAGTLRWGEVPSTGGDGRLMPDMPASLSFSTPTAITRSYAPDATA